jgi:type VI secretion system secreted protein Hcp
MKRRWVVAALMIAASVIMAGVVFGGAVDYFLKVDGVPGESQDSKHRGEIELMSWSWGETQGGARSAGGGSGAGKVNFQDVNFTAFMSSASVNFFKFCATGQHLKSAILTARQAGKSQQDFYTITFTDVLVSSYQTGGNRTNSTLPVDQFTFNFGKVEIEYKTQKADGSTGAATKAGFDLKLNKSLY